MLTRLGNYIDTIYDPQTDPKKIPAKVVLEGLGEMEYAVKRVNWLNGTSKRVIADDPNRTLHFVLAPSEQRIPPKPPVSPVFGLKQGVAVAAALAAALGACLATVGALHGNWLLVTAGAVCLGVSLALLFPDPASDGNLDVPDPRRSRNTRLAQSVATQAMRGIHGRRPLALPQPD